MIWIFVTLGILIIIQILIIGIYFSNLVLNIKECEISYNIESKNKLKIIKLKVSIDILLFKKIKILSIEIHENYCKILRIKLHFNLLKKLKSDEESGTSFIFENIWKLNPEIKNIDLQINLGTENPMLNIFIVPIITTIISGIVSKHTNNKELLNDKNSNINLKVIPEYLDKSVFYLKASTKINFDTIKTLYFIKKHQEI